DGAREGRSPLRPGADRRLLEALVTHLLDVLLRHDAAGAGGADIEGPEIGPCPLEAEAGAPRRRRLDSRDAVLQGLGRGAAIALERELHVLGGDGLAVVGPGALAKDELHTRPVRGHGP